MKLKIYAPYWATTTMNITPLTGPYTQEQRTMNNAQYAPYWAMKIKEKKTKNYLKQFQKMRQCRERMRPTVKTIKENERQSETIRDNLRQ